MEFLSLFLLILSVLSHIGISLFLAKPKFSKPVTALIWLLYAVVFLILPPDTAQLNYALMLVLNGVLFFASTKGKPAEKGFLSSYIVKKKLIKKNITTWFLGRT